MSDQDLQAPSDERSVGLEGMRRASLKVLERLLQGHATVAFIDFPRHPNFGDSLIWWGTETYLRALNKRVVYRASVYDYDPESLRSALRQDTALLLQGGGNLGDLYPHHDDLRRRVIREFPERLKIVLPQTLFARNSSWAEDSREAYASAANVTILLRDQASLDRASDVLPDSDVMFCHDLAIGAPVRRTGAAGRTPLVLGRQDDERASELSTQGARIEVSDWRGNRMARARWRIGVGLLDSQAPRLHWSPRLKVILLNAVLPRLGMLNCRQAVAQLQGRRAVATDRLHAHVLSSLLGVPNYVTDNTYGKVSEVFRYSKHVGEAHWCSTLDEAACRAGSREPG